MGTNQTPAVDDVEFDPSQPFEVVPRADAVPEFDPSQPFEVVPRADAEPEFDPSQPYEVLPPRTLMSRIREALAPGMQAIGAARALDAAPDRRPEAAALDAAGQIAGLAQAGLESTATLPGPLPGTSTANIAQAVAHPMTPVFPLPRVPQQSEDGTAAQVGAGLVNVGAGLAEGILTPLGLVSMGAAGVSTGAARLLAGAFGLDMARHLPEAAAAAGDALGAGTLQQQVEAVGGLAATAGMAGIAGRHALTPTRIAAARGLAGELQRAPVDPAAVREARPPASVVEDAGRFVAPKDAVEAADTLIDLAPRIVSEEAVAPAMAADVAPDAGRVRQRVQELRAQVEETGAEATLEQLREASGEERSAAAIALGASDDLAAAFGDGRLEPAAAELVARAAPGNANAQSVGIAALQGGASPAQAARATKVFADQFGATDAFDVIADPAQMRRLMDGGDAAALPAGTTPTTGVRMPVAVNRVVPGSQDIPGIMGQLEAVMRAAGTETPIRVGRMGRAKSWARGFFRPREEVIRLNSASNIETATHEVAHALAREFWARPAGAPASSRILSKTVPKPVVAELRQMGINLYGSRKPAAGYIEEGWAEFIRHHLTTDDLPQLAPQTTAWFRQSVLPKYPVVAKELAKARDMIDVWRGQGARGRGVAMMKPYEGKVAKLIRTAKERLGVIAQVEEFTPLEQAAAFWQRRTGATLRPGEDPYLVATRVRGIAPSVLARFVESGQLDIWGNRRPGPALADALAPVLRGLPRSSRIWHSIRPEFSALARERVKDFELYLWSRRTIERAGKGQETGLSLADAQVLHGALDSPDFRLAADRYNQWWDGILDYYAGAAPANAALVQRIRNGSRNYVPLMRDLSGFETRSGSAASARSGSGAGLRRMKGSGRPVMDVLESTMKVAGALIERAHRDLVADTVIQLAQKPGMGWLVEEVPVSQVRQAVSVGRLRKALVDEGVDLTGIPDDTLVEYMALSDRPGGVDPVYQRPDATGKMRWYVLKPEVFDILEGVNSPKVAAGMLAKGLAWTTRVKKLGTVGLRASFQLVTNPLRDAATSAIQMQGTTKPGQMFRAYVDSLADMMRAAVEPWSGGKVKPSEWWEALHDLGVPMANSIAHDIAHTRSAIRGAFHGKSLQVIYDTVNWYREGISMFESMPRLAQLRIKAAEVGWQPGQPLTPDQAVAMTVAAKRVTTDFSAGGAVARQTNLYVPFYNVAIQGVRSALRTIRAAGDAQYAERNLMTQKAALGRVAVGGAVLTSAALTNWLRNHDKEWYRALPWRERFLFTNIDPGDGNVVRIPRPMEWGNLFMVLPEAIADAWYEKDPEVAVAAVKHWLATMNPVSLPVPFEAAAEQLANRDWFWDRPIVPRSEIDLRPGEQRSEYSSWVARALGDAFPDRVSPRRVDAAIRQFGGGMASDFVRAVGLEDKVRRRESELSDLPVVGTLFRRGGQWTGNTRYVSEFYDIYGSLLARSKSATAPLGPNEKAMLKMFAGAKEEMDFIRGVAVSAEGNAPRQALYRAMSTKAKALVDVAKAQGWK